MSTSGNNVDLDSLLDLTEYDGMAPSMSPTPSTTSKGAFASPAPASVQTPNVAATTTQTLSGPSHNYDMYRQQTGFVPGALTNTMAVNQSNNTGYQDFGNLDYLSPENDIFDFNSSTSQHGMDLEFDGSQPANSQNFYPTINPSNIQQDATMAAGPQTGNVGRLWPGAHSQAALAKTQQQQQHQQQQARHQQMMAQQQQQQLQQQKARGSKAPSPSDPLVEQKITQLLNSMRAKPSSGDDDQHFASSNLPRSKKEEEEMDEDERLLASEEGKKLSSKERRQLRNKVSARAFRSRRKEYITQLEAEIATKVNENGDLRAQNRALLDENKRLTDLTRMLLSSSSFSNFLDDLSANPAAAQQQQPQQGQQQQQHQGVKMEPQQQGQQQDDRQMPKDVSPYGSQQSHQQQIGMAMIPEQAMDFSMLTIDGAYNFQPQVFVVDSLDMASPIDTAALSGKTSNFVSEEPVDADESDATKMDLPVIERPAVKEQAPAESAVVDEEFESDPEFALFHNESATTTATETTADTEAVDSDIFGGVVPEKVLARYQLVDASEEEASAAVAMARVQRISEHVEGIVSRLELLTMDL